MLWAPQRTPVWLAQVLGLGRWDRRSQVYMLGPVTPSVRPLILGSRGAELDVGEEQAGDDEDSAGAVLQVGGLGLRASAQPLLSTTLAASRAGGEEAP